LFLMISFLNFYRYLSKLYICVVKIILNELKLTILKSLLEKSKIVMKKLVTK